MCLSSYVDILNADAAQVSRPRPEERPQVRFTRLANLTSISGRPEIDGGVSKDEDCMENRLAPTFVALRRARSVAPIALVFCPARNY
jgi:hypothetical protein